MTNAEIDLKIAQVRAQKAGERLTRAAKAGDGIDVEDYEAIDEDYQVKLLEVERALNVVDSHPHLDAKVYNCINCGEAMDVGGTLCNTCLKSSVSSPVGLPCRMDQSMCPYCGGYQRLGQQGCDHCLLDATRPRSCNNCGRETQEGSTLCNHCLGS
jgi:hypothetical protein